MLKIQKCSFPQPLVLSLPKSMKSVNINTKKGHQLPWIYSFNNISPVCSWRFPGGTSDKKPACQCRRLKRCRFNPWVGKRPEEETATRSKVLVQKMLWTEELSRLHSSWVRKESDTSEHTTPLLGLP